MTTDDLTVSPRVVLLAGGVGGSTFAGGLRDEVRERGGELTVVCNTGDDLWLSGLRLQPDVDSMPSIPAAATRENTICVA